MENERAPKKHLIYMNRSVESDIYDRYVCIKSSADLGESMGVSVVSVLFMVKQYHFIHSKAFVPQRYVFN